MQRARMGIISAWIVATGGGAHAADPRLSFAGVVCGDEADVERTFIALPSADGVLSDRDLGAFNEAFGADNITPAKPKRRLRGDTWRGGWCVAESTLTVDRKALPLMVSSAGLMTGAGSDRLADSVTFIARPLDNAATAKAIKAGTLKKPAPIDADPPGDPVIALAAALADRAQMAALWSTRADVVLAGSAPGELYAGDKARKTFAAWKLDLALDGGIRWGYLPGSSEQIAWAVANVRAGSGGAAAKTPPTTYRVMFVLLGDHFDKDPEAAPEHDTWHLVLMHFALVE